MEEISFKGEKYVKASHLAEKFGYTSDYVGQLCRAGSVDAQRVGRSWYVSETSLRDHKKSRYRSTLATSKKTIEKTIEKDTKHLRAAFATPRYLQKALNYENDPTSLMPQIEKKSSETRGNVNENAEIQIKQVNTNDVPTNSKELMPKIEPRLRIVRVEKASKPVSLNNKSTSKSVHNNENDYTTTLFSVKKPSSMFSHFVLATLVVLVLLLSTSLLTVSNKVDLTTSKAVKPSYSVGGDIGHAIKSWFNKVTK